MEITREKGIKKKKEKGKETGAGARYLSTRLVSFTT